MQTYQFNVPTVVHKEQFPGVPETLNQWAQFLWNSTEVFVIENWIEMHCCMRTILHHRTRKCEHFTTKFNTEIDLNCQIAKWRNATDQILYRFFPLKPKKSTSGLRYNKHLNQSNEPQEVNWTDLFFIWQMMKDGILRDLARKDSLGRRKRYVLYR